jgi:hypothetical protein
MDSFIISNRRSFLEELDKAIPDRKDTSKGYPEIVVNAEEHLDELIRATVEKKSWFLYGVETSSIERKEVKRESVRERRQPFSLSYPRPN